MEAGVGCIYIYCYNLFPHSLYFLFLLFVYWVNGVEVSLISLIFPDCVQIVPLTLTGERGKRIAGGSESRERATTMGLLPIHHSLFSMKKEKAGTIMDLCP
jgi:hypothetical protein